MVSLAYQAPKRTKPPRIPPPPPPCCPSHSIPPAPSGREIDRVWHWASAVCQMSVLPCSDLQMANDGSVRRYCEAAPAWKTPKAGIGNLRDRYPSQALGLEIGDTFSSDLDPASPGAPEVNRLRGPAYLQGNPKSSPLIHPRAPCTEMTSTLSVKTHEASRNRSVVAHMQPRPAAAFDLGDRHTIEM